MNLSKSIRERLWASKEARLCSVADFEDLEGGESTHRILSRLEAEGEISRVGKGIYLYKPNKDAHIDLDAFAKYIAKQSGARILPSGEMALWLLKVTRKEPNVADYITTGSARVYDITSEKKIEFHRATGNVFTIENGELAMLCAAMRHIGEASVSGEVLNGLRRKVLKIIGRDGEKMTASMRSDVEKLPMWIRQKLGLSLLREVHTSEGIRYVNGRMSFTQTELMEMAHRKWKKDECVWTVAYMPYQSQASVAREMKRKNLDFFIPVQMSMEEGRGNKRKEVAKVVLRNVIFVRMNLGINELRRYVQSLPYTIWLVKETVPAKEMWAFQVACNPELVRAEFYAKREGFPLPSEGAMVRVTSGPLKGMTGRVQEVGKRKVLLKEFPLVNARIELEHWQYEVVS